MQTNVSACIVIIRIVIIILVIMIIVIVCRHVGSSIACSSACHGPRLSTGRQRPAASAAATAASAADSRSFSGRQPQPQRPLAATSEAVALWQISLLGKSGGLDDYREKSNADLASMTPEEHIKHHWTFLLIGAETNATDVEGKPESDESEPKDLWKWHK